MKTHSLLLALTVATVTIGCSSPQTEAMPAPTTTEYFKTIGGGFISSSRTLKYALNFQVRKPINGSQSWFAVVQFDNPEDQNNPLIQLNEYPSNKTDISLTSTGLPAIKNHKTYKVTVQAFSDSARTVLVTSHEMYVRFDVPDQMAASFGVKLL